MTVARTKLAVLATSAVVIVMLAAATVFNLFIGWKVEADAVNDIEYLLSLNDDAVSTGRIPNYYLVDSGYRITSHENLRATENETSLASWFSSYPDTGVVKRVSIGSWTCYAAIVPAGEYIADYDEWDYRTDWRNEPQRSGFYIAYVDIATEQALIANVNTAFVVIGIIGIVGAALAGYVAGRRIDEANDAQKRFYENMSHDLKTPLASIRGYAEGMLGGVVDSDKAARAIVRETDRMTETINDILSLSRFESGAVLPEKERVEVGDFVQDCLMPMEGTVRSKGVDVQLELAEGEIEADVNLFDHALSNVLTNAMRHADTCVRVTYDGSKLAVWNDGGAPDQDQIARMFDRFHAGDGGSTGIGLAIANEVAIMHGWRLSAHVKGEGLEVVFDF